MVNLMRVDEFAKALRIGKRKIYGDLSKGLIPHHRVGKKILIPESSKSAYLGPIIGGDVAEKVADEIISKLK